MSAELTSRQAEILALIEGGKKALEVAAELGISVHTVRVHLERIKDRIGERDLRKWRVRKEMESKGIDPEYINLILELL